MDIQQNSDYQRRVLIGRTLGILIVLGAILTGTRVWRINYQHPRTNDAMIRANIVGISAEVNGRVVELPVEDNQFVRKGQLLYVIDPRPYQAKLDRAQYWVSKGAQPSETVASFIKKATKSAAAGAAA